MADHDALPNPLIPGFHPDPSVCFVDGWYYLATSSFEYLPGIPVFRSRDLREVELIGHVAVREGQLGVPGVPTGGGAWAPTIRHHDGRFHLVVPDMLGTGRGNVLFTADDPAGPWSDGVVMEALGIDPDIAWDEDGTCYVTMSGFMLDDETGELNHLGITQVTIDTETGKALSEPIRLWSGTGGMFPEAPHLYRRGEHWYLMIAEGGTERGHSVTIARGPSPSGPFSGAPHNPLVTARGTDRAVQNTGHGDLIEMADGSWAMVLLGTRPRSTTRAFAPMGRETFIVPVTWVDGWPYAEPVRLDDRHAPHEHVVDLGGAAPAGEQGFDPELIAVRRFPWEVADAAARPGALRLTGRGVGMEDPAPDFIGIRQSTEGLELECELDLRAGAGGLSLRFDEHSHLDIEAGGAEGTVRASMHTYSLAQSWEVPLPDAGTDGGGAADGDGTADGGGADGPLARLALRIVAEPFVPGALNMNASCDTLRAQVRGADGWIDIASVDGRFLSSDVCESFTGRVGGPYAREGVVDVLALSRRGQDIERAIR